MTQYLITEEWAHLAMGDYDNMQSLDDSELNCGTTAEHLEHNTCPKKNGKVGDIHYELYVQWDHIVEADSKEEAERLYRLLDERTSEDQTLLMMKELDNYLKKVGVTEFTADEFDGGVINCEELSKSSRVGETAEERTEYLNRGKNKTLQSQCEQKEDWEHGDIISSEMIIVHEKLYYNNA